MPLGEQDGQPAPLEVYAHKLFAPGLQPDSIMREILIDRIFAEPFRSIVVLQGPAGHGKTTTLLQIKAACEARGHATGWMVFDEADNDVRRGFAHIHATLAQVLGEPVDAAMAAELARGSFGRRRSDWVADRLMRTDRPVSLFFDDFQAAQDRSLLQFFRNLVERVPSRVRLFIASRSPPDIGLPRLIIGNQALILRAEDLRFSTEEAARFFAARSDLAVSEQELSAIYTQTEGWPAALQLFRLSLSSPEVRASLRRLDEYRPRELAEYLVENVLSLQTPEVQEFLLNTAVLTRLSAGLCDVVMGRCGSREMLSMLESSGLFLRPLDRAKTWFRYHPVFSTFLAEQLDSTGAEALLRVHRRAAAWFRREELFEDAVHHFIAAGDFGEAAEALSAWTSRLIADGRLVTVERWADRLPLDEISARPDLAIKVAYALVFLRRHQKIAPLLAMLEERAGTGSVGATTNPDIVLSMAYCCVDDLKRARAAIERVDPSIPQPCDFAAFEMGAGANMTAYVALAFGDFDRAHTLLGIARMHSDRGSAGFSSGYNHGLIGVSLLMQGQLQPAVDHFREALASQLMQMEESFAAAALAACAIWALYESNALEAGERLFARHREAIAHSGLLDFVAVAYLPMSRCYDAACRFMDATALLDEAERIGHANGWGRLVRIVQWERARRLMLTGHTERARVLAGSIGAPSSWYNDGWRPFSEDVGGELISRIRFLIHAGELDEAARLLAPELNRHRDRVSQRIRLLLLEAQLLDRRGAQGPSRRSLRKALLLGQVTRFHRSFLDEGEPVLRMIREEYQAAIGDGAAATEILGVDPHYLATLLGMDAPEGGGSTPSETPHPLESLTDREREILMLLAGGTSNRHMAERVFVSENTIKFHLKNIYSKLAVANRLQAVAAARRLHLLG